MAQMVKNPPAMGGSDVGLIPGWGRSPGEGNGNHSNILAWEIHRQRSLVGFSLWGHKKAGHDLATKQRNPHTAKPCVISRCLLSLG